MRSRSSRSPLCLKLIRAVRLSFKPPIQPTVISRRVLMLLGAGVVAASVVACSGQDESASLTDETEPTTADATLTIWWEKGFNLVEDEALQKLVEDWEKQSGRDADLSLYTTDDLPQKSQRAIEAGNPPDILMSHNAERALYPHLAWQGELVDVSDVVEPVKGLYPASILDAVRFFNNAEQKRSYYAVPISQSTSYIFYWRDLVEQAGYKDSDIPRDWDGFWAFWKTVQDQLKQQGQPIYGTGFSASDKAGDTYIFFEQVLEAFNATPLTPDGDLRLSDPTVRQGVVDALKWYTDFHTSGYVPPEAVNWLNPDNNSALLNRLIVMTPNTSMTIAATVHEDPEVYSKKLVTLEFPNKRDGQPMPHILTIKQAVIFADSPRQAIAKEFLSYLIQPETLGGYLKSAGIRNLPVTTANWQDPFWTDPNDPHLSVASNVLQTGVTRPFPSVYHPAYSIVTQENVWGQAINRVVTEGVSPEQAADDAIARIQEIFEQWK